MPFFRATQGRKLLNEVVEGALEENVNTDYEDI